MAPWVAPTADEVHLWQAPLDVAPEVLDRLGAALSREESARATRYRFDVDRTRFIAARGWLRSLLARYTDCAPSEIHVTEGPHGKPRLAMGQASLRFNLSHSNDLAVCAIACEHEVGVDIEHIRQDMPIEDITRQLSPREREELAALPEVDRRRAAFDCWTRKEAYLKAVGAGLSVPLDEFDVPTGPAFSGFVLLPSGDGGQPERWTLGTFDAGPEYAAAVAVEGNCSVPAAARSLVFTAGGALDDLTE